MTPQEKARELYNKYGSMLAKDHNFRSIKAIKQCTILAIDEIVEGLEIYGRESDELQNMEWLWRYWDQVKKEIKSL